MKKIINIYQYYIIFILYTYYINNILGLINFYININLYEIYYNFKFSNFYSEIFIISISYFLFNFIVLYFLYKFININIIYNFNINNKKVYIILLYIILFLNLYFLRKNNIKAGQISISNSTFILNIFPFDIYITFYYISILYKENKNNIFKYFPIIFYMYINIIIGWTGFILFIFQLEYVKFCYKKKISLKKSLVIFYIIIFSIGSFVYSILFPLKMEIRNNTNIENIKIENLLVSDFKNMYIFGMGNLISRMSPYNSMLYLILNRKNVSMFIKSNNTYEIDKNYYSEINEIFTSIIPRFIYPAKPIYFNLNNILEKLRLGYNTNSNADITLFGKLFIASYIDIKYTILLIISNIVLLIIIYLLIIICKKQKINISIILLNIIISRYLTQGKNILLSHIFSLFVMLLLLIFIKFLFKYIFSDLKNKYKI